MCRIMAHGTHGANLIFINLSGTRLLPGHDSARTQVPRNLEDRALEPLLGWIELGVRMSEVAQLKRREITR